jgi:hypothetical protein
MRNKTAIGGPVVVIGVITLASLLTPPIRPTKVRSSQISGVNNVRTVTMTLTNTNALTLGQPSSGR